MERVEIEGKEPSPPTLLSVTSAYGHFTAMQVRNGRTRGLALHMERLASSNREAFQADFDPDRTRSLIRHALGDAADASVRVYVHRGDGCIRLHEHTAGPVVSSPDLPRSGVLAMLSIYECCSWSGR